MFYLNADHNRGAGSATISSFSGSTDLTGTCNHKPDGIGGKFVTSDAAHLEQAKGFNLVIFHANTGKEFVVNWKGDTSGGWPGVSAA